MAIDIGWIGIVGGTDNGNSVEQKLTDTFQNIEDELNALDIKSQHSLVASSGSLTTQEPTGLGDANAIQVTFGAGQITTDVTIGADGSLTFHVNGAFNFRFAAHFGRTGASGTSLLAYRILKNGVQYGNPHVAKLADSDVLTPWADSHNITVLAGDVFTAEIMRVSGFSDFGGLYSTDTIDWGSSYSAYIAIHKVG